MRNQRHMPVYQTRLAAYPVPVDELWAAYPHPAPGRKLLKRIKAAGKLRKAALKRWAERMDVRYMAILFDGAPTTQPIPRID